MNWFDPNDDVVLRPEINRARHWQRKFGTDDIDVASHVLFAPNEHGHFFDEISKILDSKADVLCDFRDNGYIHYRLTPQHAITLYKASIPAPFAANALELLISKGAQHILFVNGTGSLREDISVGELILPEELIREEGTSFHYVPADITLKTSDHLNVHLSKKSQELGITLHHGKHWTTDAIYRETFTKVAKLRSQGVISVEMELSALAAVARYRKCELSALLVVTDILSTSHSWSGVDSDAFYQGVQRAANLATDSLIDSFKE